VSLDKARALVPNRYTLQQASATTARMWIINVYCNRTSVDEHPPKRSSTTSYVGIQVSARKPDAGCRIHADRLMYLLSVATDNPVLFAHYRAAALPVQFDRRASSSQTINADGTSTLTWAFTADGLDYTVRAQPAAPLGALQPSTTSYWYDGGRRGDVRILFENLATIPSRVHIVADFTDASTVASSSPTPDSRTSTRSSVATTSEAAGPGGCSCSTDLPRGGRARSGAWPPRSQRAGRGTAAAGVG